MKKYLEVALNSPWKLTNEICMYLIKPFVLTYLKIKGVSIGKNSKFYGFPRIFKTKRSTIKIGDNFECRSWWFSNPLGINHPVIICTWAKNAKIKIGDDVGISGGSIVAAKNIEIEDEILIGANSTIIDTDFHPLESSRRRYLIKNIKSRPVKIGKNVFIGMDCIILKGVTIPNNAIVPAGSVVRKWGK
jgi:acetyltransferase-like isoleucine patch superfamily enzyme